jgi:hypothetical protein
MKTEEKLELLDLSDLLKGYEKKWVVISFDESKIIASGDSIEEISQEVNEGIVMLVPEIDHLFAGKYFQK